MAGWPDTGDGAAWLRPSPRFGQLRRLQVATVAVPVAVLIDVLVARSWSEAVGLVAVACWAAVALVVDLMLERRARSWAFLERDEDLVVRRGLLFRRQSVIPYGRMQYIDVTAGPFERLLGLASVQMHTAAAASDAHLPALPEGEAARLRDQLSRLGRSQLAGL